MPNVLVEAAGLGGFFTKLMTRLARFTINAESPSASRAVEPLLQPKNMPHERTEHDAERGRDRGERFGIAALSRFEPLCVPRCP